VSAAASSTGRRTRSKRRASFAIVVVLPDPLTPKTRITVGGTAARASAPGSLPAGAAISS